MSLRYGADLGRSRLVGLFISSSTIGFIQSELIKELNRFQFHRFYRSIFGFPVSNGEQIFSSTLSLKRGVIRSSQILNRQLPFLVDCGFLYFGFICVLASNDLHVLAEHQLPIQNLAPLEAFINLAHQSTPNRDAVDGDESGRIDLDGNYTLLIRVISLWGTLATHHSQWLPSNFPRKVMQSTKPGTV